MTPALDHKVLVFSVTEVGVLWQCPQASRCLIVDTNLPTGNPTTDAEGAQGWTRMQLPLDACDCGQRHKDLRCTPYFIAEAVPPSGDAGSYLVKGHIAIWCLREVMPERPSNFPDLLVVRKPGRGLVWTPLPLFVQSVLKPDTLERLLVLRGRLWVKKSTEVQCSGSRRASADVPLLQQSAFAGVRTATEVVVCRDLLDALRPGAAPSSAASSAG